MKNIFRKIFVVLFAILTLIGALNLSSCAEKNSEKSDYLICKKENFEKIKNKIYKDKGYEYNESGDMINAEALEVSENRLIKDKKYYLIFVFCVKDNVTDLFDVNFEICDTMGIHYGNDAVTVNSVTHDEDSKITLRDNASGGYFIEQRSASLLRWNYTYVAVEFTPKYSGMFRAEVAMGNAAAMEESKDNWDVCIDASATVFDHASYAETASEATISNLRYKRIFIDDVYKFTVNFDIDVTKDSRDSSTVYCVIYMHNGDNVNGSWDDVTVNNADTSTFSELKSEYGKMLIFSYRADYAEKKSAEISLHFENMENMDIDVFITGDNVCVDGTTHETYKAQ